MAAMILAWPGALAIGLSLGLLGSGGSILTVPVLVYLVGQEERLAIAGSLAIVGMIAAAAVVPYLKERLVHWRSVWLFGIPGMLGTYLGAWSSVFVTGEVQLAAFAVVMVLASWFMLRSTCPEPVQGERPMLKIAAEGLAVGAVTGFVGVGGGFLVVPALVLLGGLSMHRAVPTSLIIIALKSATGFYKYTEVLAQENLSLDWTVIGAVTAVGIIGSFAGSAVAVRLPQETLKRYFGWFLVGMGLFILYRSLPALLV